MGRRVRALPVAGLLLACGCSGPPVIDATPAEGDRAACLELVDVLPGRLDDLDRRDVEPPDAAGAAWGDPAVVLTCGVPPPDGLTRASPCLEASGIGWYVDADAVQDLGGGAGADAQDADEAGPVTFTTIGTDPLVSVDVPPDYRPPAGLLADLADPLRAAVAQVAPCR